MQLREWSAASLFTIRTHKKIGLGLARKSKSPRGNMSQHQRGIGFEAVGFEAVGFEAVGFELGYTCVTQWEERGGGPIACLVLVSSLKLRKERRRK